MCVSRDQMMEVHLSFTAAATDGKDILQRHGLGISSFSDKPRAYSNEEYFYILC